MSVRVIDVMISCRLCTDRRSRTGVRQARDTSRHASTRESVTSLCYTNGWSVLKSTKFFKLGLLEREREGGRGGSGGSYIVQHTDGVQEEHDVSEHLLCPFLEMFSLCP